MTGEAGVLVGMWLGLMFAAVFAAIWGEWALALLFVCLVPAAFVGIGIAKLVERAVR